MRHVVVDSFRAGYARHGWTDWPGSVVASEGGIPSPRTWPRTARHVRHVWRFQCHAIGVLRVG